MQTLTLKLGDQMNGLRSSMAGFAVKTIFAVLLMVGLVACPENPDLIPESFVVPPVTGAALGVDVSSAAFTVTGINAPVPISVIGGKYQIDSAPFTSTSGTVSGGQTVKVSLLSSVNFGTTKTASITVGGITAPFNVTTLAADTTPDSFSFPAVNNLALSTLSVSDPVTVAGVNTDAPTSISSGGEYAIDSTTNFVSSPGTVKNAQVVRVRATSSNAFNTPVNVVLTIGGVTRTFTITTRQADTTPDAFSFTPVPGATPNIFIFSNPVTITGIDSSAKVTISGGLYKINAGSFTDSEGTITNGQSIQVKGLSSPSFSTVTNTILTIGGVSATFTVTTREIDTAPNDFLFPNLTNVPIKTETTSASVVLDGFDSAPISIVGGSYKINNGAFTNQAGTIQNGDTLTLSILSASIPLTGKDLLVTVGGVNGVGGVQVSWSVNTNNFLLVLPNETLPLAIPDGIGINTTRSFGDPRIITFTVPDTVGLKLEKIKVRVKINHTFRTDLQILIFAPNNFSNQLFDTTATNSADNVDVTFDGDSPDLFVPSCINAGSTCTGVIKPLGAFTNLNILNQNPKGQWRIEVRDAFVQDTGTVEVMELQLIMKL
jgi:subtilisin-like proprotein convertase family protein